MGYLGDIAEDATIRGSFNTRAAATGAPITLAGTPALSVYKDGGVTESTAGVNLTVDFDSRTGHHVFTIDTSADAFYATGSDYRIVITAGTVDSVSVVGVEVGSFSIQNRYMRGTDGANTVTPPTVAEFEARTLPAADYFVTTDLPAFPANFAALGINESGHISRVVLVDTTTTNTDMRGTDSANTTTPPTSAAIADAVWDEAIAGHATPGSTGAALSSAGSSGDPWSTALPASYTAGTAGYIVGTFLDSKSSTIQQGVNAIGSASSGSAF